MPLGRQLINLDLSAKPCCATCWHTTPAKPASNCRRRSPIRKPSPAARASRRRHRILPLAVDFDAHILTVAVPDLFNLVAQDQVRAYLEGRYDIRPVLAAEAQISNSSTSSTASTSRSTASSANRDRRGGLEQPATGRRIHASGGAPGQRPARRRSQARRLDVHFEPEAAFLRVRYRIDGVLEPMRSLHRKYWPAVAVRLKVISGLNIAESRAPRTAACRSPVWPQHRLPRLQPADPARREHRPARAGPGKSIIALEAMGLPDATLARLQKAIARPEGLLIVTGPTGPARPPRSIL